MDQKKGESFFTFAALLWLVMTTSKGEMPVVWRFPGWLPYSLFPGWYQLIRSIRGRRNKSIHSKRKTSKNVHSECRSLPVGWGVRCWVPRHMPMLSRCNCCVSPWTQTCRSVSVASQLATVILDPISALPSTGILKPCPSSSDMSLQSFPEKLISP